MAEETSNAMNLDLNLGPSPEPGIGLIPGSVPGETVNLDDWIEGPIRRLRDAARQRARQRWRWRQVQVPLAPQNISMELSDLMVNSSVGTALQAGEGSAAAEERTNDAAKICENSTCFLEDGEADNKGNAEKGGGNEGSYFDCNICLDLARDPVVTCCGHLFCWPCLYRWLHIHADVKECPVCKGEVTVKNVTPIYGRGNNARAPEEDPSIEIPGRPHARRVESLRQTIQRTAFNIPMEEMIRRLGSRFDLTGDLIQQQDSDPSRETVGRTSSLLDRFLLSRAIRIREQNPVPPPDDAVDLTQTSNTSAEVENRHLRSYLLRRSQSHRHSAISSLSTALTAERLVEAYLRNHTLGRSQEQPPPVDDRDSFSSIAAGINSESQVDTAMEIDSLVSLSTSTSRRRDPSRVSDLDSGDSRAPRRRRLN